MSKQCNAEIAEAENQIQELEHQMFSKEEFRKHMESIRATLEAARRDAKDGMISAEFVGRYIDKILVTPEDDGALRLDIKIFTRKTTEKHFEKLRFRTGHTFKKIPVELQDSRESAGFPRDMCRLYST